MSAALVHSQAAKGTSPPVIGIPVVATGVPLQGGAALHPTTTSRQQQRGNDGGYYGGVGTHPIVMYMLVNYTMADLYWDHNAHMDRKWTASGDLPRAVLIHSHVRLYLLLTAAKVVHICRTCKLAS
jgi:hypothetical protein